ncbi:unnamed protein product [Periconia digitata]|uniref:Secreted protein n=1 Tax=Periconia digitata TaxID=1303443 RepID=A0A9W4ULB4_9PLEO|nr:unnamed protein product [Periconia digitata]
MHVLCVIYWPLFLLSHSPCVSFSSPLWALAPLQPLLKIRVSRIQPLSPIGQRVRSFHVTCCACVATYLWWVDGWWWYRACILGNGVWVCNPRACRCIHADTAGVRVMEEENNSKKKHRYR